MKLRRINVSGINDILVFDSGPDGQLAIWNHVCDGTSCLASEFDTKINFLLNAHGVHDIHITAYHVPAKEKKEIGCESCKWIVAEKSAVGGLLVGCGYDPKLEYFTIDLMGIDDERDVRGKIHFATKERASPCANYSMQRDDRVGFGSIK